MSEIENIDAIRDAFDAAVNAGKSADEVKVEMIKAGCQFKDTGKLYKEWGLEAGVVVDTKARAEQVDGILSSMDNLDTEDGFNDAIDAIMDGVDNTSEKQAGSLLRTWCKKNDVTPFKKPKGSGGNGKNGINAKILNFLKDNPHTDEASLDDFINEHGSETTKKTWRNHYQNIRSVVNAVAA